MSIKARISKRLDGWMNALSGLGVQGRDKRVGYEWQYDRLGEIDVETLYASDDVARALVDKLPEEGLREWIELKHGDEDSEMETEDALTVLQARARLEQAWKWGRLYGGAGIFMTIDDGLDPQEPVDEERIKVVKSLTVLSRYELIPFQINSDLDSPYFGEPEIYLLQTSQPTDFVQRFIHHSRLLRFDGASLPRRLLIQNQWWGDSILTRAKNSIVNYNSAHDSAVSALQDFSVGVFKIRNLAELISSGQEDKVRARLEIANYSKSVIKAVLIDGEESYEQVSKSLSGVPEMLKQATARLVVAADGIPHTKLLGESPSGLGATGDSEERNWYDHVKNNQKIILKPALDRLLKYIYLSKFGPTSGKIPEDATYDFVPLWQMSGKEQAEMEYVVAQKDQIYIQNGVVDPDEVATSRYAGDVFSQTTVIDPDKRRELPPTEGNEGATADPKPPKGKKTTSPAEDENVKIASNMPDPGYVARTDNLDWDLQTR